MTYLELIQQLLKINVESGVKLGLQNVQRLQQLLAFPDRSFASIHVAGTNGKGSVCIKIAHALEKAGYKVGLFTSPHLSSFRERIRINDQMIPEAAVESLLPSLLQIVNKADIPATFFEITTFLAFLYFARENIDIAVLETGLGGRLDATNVVHPCLSVITSISLDHTEILGPTREEIAKEKGGIIKEGVPVIIGPRVPLAPIQALADQKISPCMQVREESPLYEMENRAIAKASLDYLASIYTLTLPAIEQGLAAKQPCRLEILEGPPLIVLDVAHNPDGICHLFQAIQHQFPSKPLRLLFGLSKSKDLCGCLQSIVPHGSHYHLVEAPNGRGAALELLNQHLQAFSIQPADISLHDSIVAGVQTACAEALTKGELLVIFGSFFIMGEVRRALNYHEPYDAVDINERAMEKSCQDKKSGI